MQYTTLGRTGVSVSRLCFGTMSFGGDADEPTSAAMFHRCREAGVNFFDTANVYNQGEAERILGRLIHDCRDELVITSKVHGPAGPDRNDRGLSRRHIMRAVEDSLDRLGTDRLDLYFAHQVDPATPMDQTLAAFDDLVRQGKVLYPAVSNWPAWRTARALGLCERHRWARFECLQPMYSLVKRQAEVELLPLAEAEGLAVIPYSPLGAGLLTGKYTDGDSPAVGRIRDNRMYARRYADDAYRTTADRFVAHARERGVNPATLAVAWVMHHPAVTAPIIGARHVEQLEASLHAADVEMTPAWRNEIAALSPVPPIATDRTEERPAGG